MAALTCQCGAVEIKFFAGNDLFRLQCCCHDCTAALWYANNRGGPTLPPYQCLDSSYLPNDFEIRRGQDKLGAFQNFVHANTTRIYCTDCWTVLFGDHPKYEAQLVVTQVGNFTGAEYLTDVDLMPLQARHFLRDLSAGQRAVLPHWRGDPAHVYEGPAKILVNQWTAIRASGRQGAKLNAQKLLKSIGSPFVPANEPRLCDESPTYRQKNGNGPVKAACR